MDFGIKNTPYKARNKYFNYVNKRGGNIYLSSSSSSSSGGGSSYVVDWDNIHHAYMGYGTATYFTTAYLTSSYATLSEIHNDLSYVTNTYISNVKSQPHFNEKSYFDKGFVSSGLSSFAANIKQTGNTTAEFTTTYVSNLFSSNLSYANTLNVDENGYIGGDLEFGDNEYSIGLQGAKIYKNNNNAWVGEFDNVVVHNKLQATTVEIQHEKHLGGKLIVSPADMIISNVEAITSSGVTTGYKCYFNTKDKDGRDIKNFWRVNDQALCRNFSIYNAPNPENSYTLASKYYWRKVTSTGEDYVILSNTQQGTRKGLGGGYVGTDIPEIGDEIVCLGNQVDTSRQGAIILKSIDISAAAVPAMTVYNNINDFSLTETFISTSATGPNPAIIQFSPSDSFITSTTIKLSSGKTVEEVFEGLTDNTFDIWQETTRNAPKASGVILQRFLYNAYDYLPSYSWTEQERISHLHDDLIFMDGVVYEFNYIEDYEDYYWVIVTDAYLISVVQDVAVNTSKVNDITADGKITNAERLEIRYLYDDIYNSFNELANKYNSELTAEGKTRVTLWNDFNTASNTLMGTGSGYIYLIINSSGTITLGTSPYTFSRQQLNTAINTFYYLQPQVKRQIEDARLYETGIYMGTRQIIARADNFIIKNNSNENTLYVNEVGDLNIKGILNQNSITITGSNAKSFLIPVLNVDFMTLPDYHSWTYYAAQTNRGTREYASDNVITFNPFISSDDYSFDNDYLDNTHSLDVMRINGLVTLESSLITNTWLCGSDSGKVRNLLLLPYMRYVNYESGQYIFDTLRTPTKNESSSLHLMTLEEMRGLIGKHFTICNNTGAAVWILCSSHSTSEASSITYARSSETPSTSPTYTDIYTMTPAYVLIGAGKALSIEYKELVYDGTDVSDIIPCLTSISSASQNFSKAVINASDTFGANTYPF